MLSQTRSMIGMAIFGATLMFSSGTIAAPDGAASFCEGVEFEAEPSPFLLLERAVKSKGASFAERDADLLLSLVDGFGLERPSWPNDANASHVAELIAMMALRGELISMEIAHVSALQNHPDWRNHDLSKRVTRLLETALVPFEDTSSLETDFAPSWTEKLKEQADHDLNQVLRESIDAQRQARERLSVFNQRPVRWYLQGVLYNDLYAQTVARALICNDAQLKLHIDEVVNEASKMARTIVH